MGILTTIVNIATFFIFIHAHLDYKFATTIAWVVSILFAYVTNKIYVFKSKTKTRRALAKELLAFVWFRLLSYFIDIGSMILMVSYINTNETFAKLIANIIVVIANYGFSKWFIFKHTKEKQIS